MRAGRHGPDPDQVPCFLPGRAAARLGCAWTWPCRPKRKWCASGLRGSEDPVQFDPLRRGMNHDASPDLERRAFTRTDPEGPLGTLAGAGEASRIGDEAVAVLGQEHAQCLAGQEALADVEEIGASTIRA